MYVGAVVAGCLLWKFLGPAAWQASLSLMVFLICVPVVLDAFVRRSD